MTVPVLGQGSEQKPYGTLPNSFKLMSSDRNDCVLVKWFMCRLW